MKTNVKESIFKFIIFLYMVYLLWYSEAIGYSNILLYGGIIIVVISFLLYINGRSTDILRIPSGLLSWIAYGVTSLIIGLLIAADRGLLISSLMTFFAFIFLCICISVVSRVEQNSQWFTNYLLAICVLCALYTIFNGYDYYNGVMVVTMGANNNPNTLGTLMVFGMFAVMYNEKKGVFQLVEALILLALFLYIIIITGSKKALLGGGVFLLIWIIGFLKDLKGKKLHYKITSVLIIAAICLIAFYYFTSTYMNTASFERMTTLFTSGSTKMRSEMYEESIDFFKRSPLFGIGYDQFRVLSRYKLYSHSTYAEVMADGGIIGMLLFITPILIAGFRLFKLRKRTNTYTVWIFIALYCVEVFLGAVNIFMYDITHLLIWSLVFFYTQYGAFYNEVKE